MCKPKTTAFLRIDDTEFTSESGTLDTTQLVTIRHSVTKESQIYLFFCGSSMQDTVKLLDNLRVCIEQAQHRLLARIEDARIEDARIEEDKKRLLDGD